MDNPFVGNSDLPEREPAEPVATPPPPREAQTLIDVELRAARALRIAGIACFVAVVALVVQFVPQQNTTWSAAETPKRTDMWCTTDVECNLITAVGRIEATIGEQSRDVTLIDARLMAVEARVYGGKKATSYRWLPVAQHHACSTIRRCDATSVGATIPADPASVRMSAVCVCMEIP